MDDNHVLQALKDPWYVILVEEERIDHRELEEYATMRVEDGPKWRDKKLDLVHKSSMSMETTTHPQLGRGAIGNMVINSPITYCCNFLIIVIIVLFKVGGDTHIMHQRVQFYTTIACSFKSPMNPELHRTIYMMRKHVRDRGGLSSTRSRLDAFEYDYPCRGGNIRRVENINTRPHKQIIRTWSNHRHGRRINFSLSDDIGSHSWCW